MKNVIDFIKWALTHVQSETIPADAVLPLPAAECGSEPWHYLFGTVMAQTTESKLEERWENYYSTHGWTRAKYDAATEGWRETDYATDCQGLLDAWFTYVIGEKTDINANMNYTSWCTEKGKINEIDRPFIIGEAVFKYNGTKMNHVGWVCGFASDGVPLVIEARGIAYGVVVTRMDKRNWTNRGLMTKKFDYTPAEPERAVFEVRSPMLKGLIYSKMQDTLDAAGYTDADGKRLEIDGKWGKKSQQAFDKLITDYAHESIPVEPVEHEVVLTVDGTTAFTGLI